jgi:hypothetical protein
MFKLNHNILMNKLRLRERKKRGKQSQNKETIAKTGFQGLVCKSFERTGALSEETED